jgi:hypothetical protein
MPGIPTDPPAKQKEANNISVVSDTVNQGSPLLLTSSVSCTHPKWYHSTRQVGLSQPTMAPSKGRPQIQYSSCCECWARACASTVESTQRAELQAGQYHRPEGCTIEYAGVNVDKYLIERKLTYPSS